MKQVGVLLLPLDETLVYHRLPKHEVARSITTPLGWDASPSQGTQTRLLLPLDRTLVHHRIPKHEVTRIIATLPG